MSKGKMLLSKWILLSLASALAGLVGIFSIYVVAGAPVSAAFGFAWPVALISGGIGALVIPGPLVTTWTAWEIFVLEAPNDFNGLALLVCLPSTFAVAIVTAVGFLARRFGREWIVWPLTLLLVTGLYTTFTVVTG